MRRNPIRHFLYGHILCKKPGELFASRSVLNRANVFSGKLTIRRHGYPSNSLSGEGSERFRHLRSISSVRNPLGEARLCRPFPVFFHPAPISPPLEIPDLHGIPPIPSFPPPSFRGKTGKRMSCRALHPLPSNR